MSVVEAFVFAIFFLLGYFALFLYGLRGKKRTNKTQSSRKYRIVFLHPDLGLGGAEKYVVETAVLLQEHGHTVEIVTNRHDRARSFPQTSNGTLQVSVAGDCVPRTIAGRFHILCATLRFFAAAVFVLRRNRATPYDVIMVDQISTVVPLLKLSGAGVFFYCHFPDQLLTQRKTLIKRLYRLPFDYVEEVTTAMADKVVVNSEFTAGVFRRTFTSVRVQPTVLYPCIDHRQYEVVDTNKSELSQENLPKADEVVLLSINRFERKKNVVLAIEALQKVLAKLSTDLRKHVVLYLAGGYDTDVRENVEHFNELQERATSLGVSAHVRFQPSVSDEFRNYLLRRCLCLLYTPPNEHFGLVPLEASLAGKAVIACNSGGPLETIRDGETGFLRAPEAEAWAEVTTLLVADPGRAKTMGKNAREFVLDNFGVNKYYARLQGILDDLAKVW